ncbi:hypothetical protein DBIPINDM_006279 [Mesorhizobium sp. AR02]|uniref:hypothetical protein n=1 Tax=Mesorhizobium sp. AR02 TaxID=2865837 RepID=UPI0021610836|nr:hypothetical protein [Mesorhizobium sp. AR02]UVK52846.1 hypothetical protein DBIPINDM_006279 [Mesorhizobium sp. AR02]
MDGSYFCSAIMVRQDIFGDFPRLFVKLPTEAVDRLNVSEQDPSAVHVRIERRELRAEQK